jgi:hypothetical protein
MSKQTIIGDRYTMSITPDVVQHLLGSTEGPFGVVSTTRAAQTPWPITSQMKIPALVSESFKISKKSPLTLI